VNFCDTNCSFDWKDGAFDDGYEDTSPVGSYPNGASPYGVLDMAGNVSEWVNDWHDETYYSRSPIANPLGSESGQSRVLRGGSWNDDQEFLRSALRFDDYPSLSIAHYGFRCAMDANPEEIETSQVDIRTPRPSLNNPQDDPLSVWKGIPIMPLAINGHQSDDENSYSYTIDVMVQEAVDYFDGQLLNLGWEKLDMISLYDETGGFLVYDDNVGIRLVIAVSYIDNEWLLVSMEYPFNGLFQ
jgi:hypothetical protein